ncbi:MAG: ATP-binding protein [Thermoflexales bacterium]|nr:ATP-binding protein [Thermoflexales bacterium]MDW8352672.1 ATP-binding protein [Anaerolineae bacterium]
MTSNLLSPLNPLVPRDLAQLQRDELPMRLGVVVGGSLNDGVLVKLDSNMIVEGVAVGSYVTIKGQTDRKFFGLVTDIQLAAIDPALAQSPPADGDLRTEIYRGTVAYGMLHVKPMLVKEGQGEAKPVKSVPAHFTAVYRATPDEVQEIFAADERTAYRIGATIEDENIEIKLNLERLVERSSAVFGRSGTGKTFLTLPLLAAVIRRDLASVLIFDMHNDYGYTLKGDGNRTYKGLKQLNAISHKVVIVTLDEASSKARGSRPEFALQIGYDQIEPEDIEMLRSELSLSDVQVNALHALRRHSPDRWVSHLLSDNVPDEVQELFESNKIAEGTYLAMQRKLGRLSRFEFLRPKAAENFAERVLDHLTRGESVVVEFGRYGNDLLAYIFVANFLSRRIHRRYVEMKEAAEGGGGEEPKKLVIAVEEAHKFLEPGVADLTIFGTIARELRKYNVTLLIVDQRPSQIDAEVMSQIGTRITCALSDERDIAAVFTGVSGAQQLRSVLAALQSKQQALIMGHAVPMPVVVRTTEYGELIYQEFAEPLNEASPEERAEINRKKLGRRPLDEGLV